MESKEDVKKVWLLRLPPSVQSKWMLKISSMGPKCQGKTFLSLRNDENTDIMV